jgi:ectoine hydroxylase-related dioxygenase (phytanoyl-CoA dioxygenase family)
MECAFFERKTPMHLTPEIETKSSFIEDLKNDGVIILREFIPADQMHKTIAAVHLIREIVMAKVDTMVERPIRVYSDIVERHLGRLDYRCGFNAPIFSEVAKQIADIIQAVSPQIDFSYYWGVVTSLGKAGPTNMHRDVYPILNSTTGVNLGSHDLSLPPYYFTVLIPLVDVNRENGPTEFIKASHTQKVVNESSEKTFAPLVTPGDIIIFDGRTMHRGMANNTTQERLVAYVTFIANWYHDQTFIKNDYLFPELLR